jgi:alpha-beta hydrolase superfamily lysophospholipase
VQTDTRLIDVTVPEDPAGVVLVLHGGASRQRSMRVSPTQLSVLRMIPVASRIARAGEGRLAVLRLLNSRRGWDAEHTPAQDVKWALAEVAQRFGPELPACLVGHSLGGRAALMEAGEPPVRGVVALAPWVHTTDGADDDLHDTPIVMIHGDADRIASADKAEQVAETLRLVTPVTYVSVAGGTHTMLGHRDAFDGLAARCVAWMLLGSVEGEVMERIRSGATWLEVTGSGRLYRSGSGSV